MQPSKMIAPASSAGPLWRASGQRTDLQARRRELLRIGLIVGISVSVATLAVVAASFVGTHLAAKWWLESHQGVIVWDINETNWRQGGVTTASFPTGRFNLSNLSDSDLDHLHRLHRLVSLNFADNHEISDKGLAALRGLDFLTELSLERLVRYRLNSTSLNTPL